MPIIDFEDLNPGGPGTGATVIVNSQYSSLGAQFNDPVALDYSQGLPIANFTHSGTKAIEQCYAQEFCNTPIRITFTTPQAHVKLWAGYSSSLMENYPIVMRAFSESGAEVARTEEITFLPSDAPRPINTPLEINTSDAVIKSVTIGPSTANQFSNNLAIDDVEFNTAGPAPVEEEDFFYSEGKMLPVVVALDQLGVVARDNVTRSQLQEYLSRFQLKLVQEYPQGIFIFELSSTLSRPEIVKLARTVAGEGQQLVAYAGFTATPKGAQTPFIVIDEFIAQFNQGITRAQIDVFNEENRVEIVEQDPFVENQFLLKVTGDSPFDALDMANLYHEGNLTVFSHPNFVRIIDFRQFIPSDSLFGNQWHHQNTGTSGGTVDADVDTPLAWDINQGAAGTIIAVIDDGFDMTHPDLTPNFWVNAGEVPGNGIDDDVSGFVDDINGFDFRGNDGNPAAGTTDDHGTAVAGVAAARGNNALGVSGSCPNCSIMLIRSGHTVQQDANSFGYAQQMGAQIITNSWGYTVGTPTTTAVVNAINNAATFGRGGLGAVILFAMNNGNFDDCIGATPDISSLANVIAVSASSNQDRKVIKSAWGNCMDVVAPTHRGYAAGDPYTGTLNIATTDRQGTNGYNNVSPLSNCPSTEPTTPPADARDYTLCFGGTSSATPLTAGIAGIILTANPGLTRVQVQQLLQDSADKIEDSVGRYATSTGFSNPVTGVATHGWGRVNSFEAMRIAAPAAQGGLGGADIFLRDNRLDWGNTEQRSNTLFEPTRGFIGHWLSEDIKVDAPPYQPAPITGADFESLIDETPSAVAGDVNRVYVRVHNRGPVTESPVTVKLQWSQFGTALPALPSDFWTAFPADSISTMQWHPLNCTGTASSTCTITNLAYSGSSVATTAADAAQIVAFDFPAPPISAGLSNHFCLLAMIDSPRDPISPNSKTTFVVDDITPRDNNISHRNYVNLPTSRDREFAEGFIVRNPTDRPLQTVLRLEAPEGWSVGLDKYDFDRVFTLEPNQEVLVSVDVALPDINQEGVISIVQERLDNRTSVVMGGLAYQFSPRFPTPSPTEEEEEDCLPFNPQTTVVAEVDGIWTIADGSHLIMDFPNKDEADRALAIIKHFGMNDICFVGRPDPSMTYFLVDGSGPAHTPETPVGQDCLPFNPQTTDVIQQNGIWTIADGSHLIMDFPNKDEADRSLSIIKKYGFSDTCFVGRPDPSMTYFLPEFPLATIIFVIAIGTIVGLGLLMRTKLIKSW